MGYTVVQHKLTEPCRTRLATGEEYGVLLTVRGTASVCGRWSLNADDLLVCKPRQVLELEYAGGRVPLTLLWVRISPEQMAACSTPGTDILEGFGFNPAPVAGVSSQSETLMLLKSLAMQLLTLSQKPEEYASDLLVQASLQMFLGFVLKVCAAEDPYRAKPDSKRDIHLVLDDVFAYIHRHLTEEITLGQLEQEFYVSRHHLIREFKKRTGQTVHRYIVKARLDLCRKYIEQGYSITEVYRMGGFGGYNHFFRAFKQVYGMTPKEYYRSIQAPEQDTESS